MILSNLKLGFLLTVEVHGHHEPRLIPSESAYVGLFWSLSMLQKPEAVQSDKVWAAVSSSPSATLTPGKMLAGISKLRRFLFCESLSTPGAIYSARFLCQRLDLAFTGSSFWTMANF
jgi:hypothetical protein